MDGDDVPQNGPADVLRRVADTLEKNNPATFGGLAVVIPPQGDTIEVLILDPATHLAQFWSLIQTRIQLSIKALEDQGQRGWTGR